MQNGVEVNDGDEIAIIGNYTSEGSTVEQEIFSGRITDVNLEEPQLISVISKAEEIDTIKPEGVYKLYTECLLGALITDYCSEVTCEATEDTCVLSPDSDIGTSSEYEAESWEDHTGGNNNGILYDDIITDDNLYIYSCHHWDQYWFTINNPSLSDVYHYDIWKISVSVTAKAVTGNAKLSFWYYTNDEWSSGNTTGYFYSADPKSTQTVEWTDLHFAEDDLDDLQVKIRYDGWGDINVYRVYVTLYYRYYPNLDKGTYKSTQTYKKEKSLREIFNWGKVQELKTWYLTPDLEFQFNGGDIDSGIDISPTDFISDIKGKKLIKNYDKVILLGGFVSGEQISSEAGEGTIVWTKTFANITNQTTLDNLAAQILANKQTFPLTVQMYRVDPTKGLIQAGEEATIEEGIHYNSTNTIPTGQYKLSWIKYYIVKGVYTKVDLTLDDGVVYKIEDETTQVEENTQLIQQLNDRVDLVEEGGEVNTGSNVGTDGVGVYDGKVEVDLQFRHIAPASSKITTTLNGNDIDVDVVINQINHDGLLNYNANRHLLQSEMSLANLGTRAHSNLTGIGSSDHHVKYTDAEAVAAVLADDKYVKNYQNDAMDGTFTCTGLIINGDSETTGTFDGVDVAGLKTDFDAHNHDEDYLGIDAKAADSDKLDNIDSTSFVRNDQNCNLNGHLEFQDNVQCKFGNDGDVILYHNDTDMYLKSYKHGGRFLFQGENEAGDNKALLYMDPDNSIDLYYAGTKKFETTANGINVIGGIYDDGVQITQYSDVLAVAAVESAGLDILKVATEIQHTGDSNNSIAFGADTQTFEVGGSTQIDITTSGVRFGGAGQRVAQINNGALADTALDVPTSHAVVDYVAENSGGDKTKHIELQMIMGTGAAETSGRYFLNAYGEFMRVSFTVQSEWDDDEDLLIKWTHYCTKADATVACKRYAMARKTNGTEAESWNIDNGVAFNMNSTNKNKYYITTMTIAAADYDVGDQISLLFYLNEASRTVAFINCMLEYEVS